MVKTVISFKKGEQKALTATSVYYQGPWTDAHFLHQPDVLKTFGVSA
jgi:hypothetical protein